MKVMDWKERALTLKKHFRSYHLYDWYFLLKILYSCLMNFHVKFDKFTFPLLLSYQQSPDIKGF